MRATVLVLSLALVAALAPSVDAAASQKTYAFTSSVNGASPVAGTLALANSAPTTGAAVGLPVNSPVTWVYPTPLAAGVTFSNGAFSFDLYLSNPVGTVKVVFGDYEQDATTHTWHFRALKASAPTNVDPAPRSILAPLGPIPSGNSLNVGHATATISGINGAFPAGSYPALQVISSNSNGLYTTATTLGATSNSSATVPLPELPALALLAVGAALVGGVVLIRSRKGWT